MSELDVLTSRAADLSSRVGFWNTAVVWALLITALAAAAIVVSQRLAFVRAKQLVDVPDKMTRIKEADASLERERVAKELADAVARAKEADARIAEAERGSAEANERATEAQESLSLAEQHSAEANAKAEGFRLDIAKANERAAAANEIAQREAVARLQLEARLADRTLTPEWQSRLRAMAASFPNTRIDIFLWGGTLEIARIAGAINKALADGGWTVRQWQVTGGGAVRGILVGTVPSGADTVANAITVRAASLRWYLL